MEFSWDFAGFYFSIIGSFTLSIYFYCRYISEKNRADHDSLTGLYTRKCFINKSKQKSNGDYALGIVDIDKFKDINDTYGHKKGDDVLSKMGHIFKTFSSEHNAYVARLGGEEFGFLVDSDSANDFFETLREEIEQCSFLRGENITISVGYARYKSDYRSPSEWLHAADRFLYDAKEAGRNKVLGDI